MRAGVSSRDKQDEGGRNSAGRWAANDSKLFFAIDQCPPVLRDSDGEGKNSVSA